MSKLYRIKPLVWEEGVGIWWSGEYAIFQYADDSFEVRACHIHVSGNETLDDAKTSAELHRRRKLLEAELEPAYQPSTELPTEPGWYWFIGDSSAVWFLEGGKVFRGLYGTRVDRDKWDMKGQWVRIPEPEVGL